MSNSGGCFSRIERTVISAQQAERDCDLVVLFEPQLQIKFSRSVLSWVF